MELFPDDPELNQLAWMTGSWARRDGDTLQEEHWTQPVGGTMLGLSRHVGGGHTVFHEFFQIAATPDGIVYLASPKGRCPPTPFTLVETAPRRVVFENPAHDFPQRISYWLTNDGNLHARIAGVQDGQNKSSEWQWQPSRNQ